MKTEEVVLLAGAAFLAFMLLRSSGERVSVEESEGSAPPPPPHPFDTPDTPLGLRGSDVKIGVGTIGKAAGGASGPIGAAAVAAQVQWDISPASVIGGIAMGPLGTVGGLIYDQGGNVVRGFSKVAKKIGGHMTAEEYAAWKQARRNKGPTRW